MYSKTEKIIILVDSVLNIDRLGLFSILFLFLITSCSSVSNKNDIIIGNEMILYENIQDGNYNLVLLNLEESKEFPFIELGNVQESDYLFYDRGTKLLIFPNHGFYGDFYIYDIKNAREGEHRFIYPGERTSNFYQFRANDSLLLFTNGSDILFKSLNHSQKVDTIKINAVSIGQIALSNKNILGVFFNSDSSNLNDFGLPISTEFREFNFIDLKTKNKINHQFKPKWIGNWSPDGRYLLFRDSVAPQMIEYPSFNITELDGFKQDSIVKYNNLYFLRNDLIVFNGLIKSQSNWQIYLYDINKQMVTQRLAEGNSDKEIVDVFYKY